MKRITALAQMVPLILALCTGPITPTAAAETPLISGIRATASPTGLRLIIDIDPVPAFTIFTLNGPDRLVIDFPVVRWQLADRVDISADGISAVRHGLFRYDRSRLILDLASPLAVERAYTKPPGGTEPGRLIVDLVPSTRVAFDIASGPPEVARWQGRAPPGPAPRGGDIVVAIDPGHGGVDPGTSSGGFVEKVLVLEFAHRLAAEIDARDGLTAYLIRDRDEFVPLAERIARAHAARANLLISLHADSVQAGVANGMSVYTLSQQGTDAAADLFASRENRADVLAGADLFGETDGLTRLLVELAQRGTDDESRKLAAALIETIGHAVPLLGSRPLRSGNFRVLKAPDLPSVLIELGFLDSPKDQERLGNPDWQARAVKGVVDGIVSWRKVASPGFLAPR